LSPGAGGWGSKWLSRLGASVDDVDELDAERREAVGEGFREWHREHVAEDLHRAGMAVGRPAIPVEGDHVDRCIPVVRGRTEVDAEVNIGERPPGQEPIRSQPFAGGVAGAHPDDEHQSRVIITGDAVGIVAIPGGEQKRFTRPLAAGDALVVLVDVAFRIRMAPDPEPERFRAQSQRVELSGDVGDEVDLGLGPGCSADAAGEQSGEAGDEGWMAVAHVRTLRLWQALGGCRKPPSRDRA